MYCYGTMRLHHNVNTKVEHIMANTPPTTLNENAKAWVAALQSGDYQQRRDLLDLIEQDAKATLRIASDLVSTKDKRPAHREDLFNA